MTITAWDLVLCELGYALAGFYLSRMIWKQEFFNMVFAGAGWLFADYLIITALRSGMAIGK